MRHPSFTIIAHRGASAYAPENTLAAFDKALDMTKGPSGADGSTSLP
jgi:glycerophosphoryl diester phosphodiesterase